jgi:hypothetical protein
MNRYIDTIDENGMPCKGVRCGDNVIVYPYESPCGRFFVVDPKAEYGLTDEEIAFLKDQELSMQFYKHERFVCYWNADKGITEVHGSDFFTRDNGYSEEDIYTVSQLLIGESADLSAPMQEHYVMRVA